MGDLIDIRRFDAQTAAPDEWSRLHAFRRRRAAEDDPGEPVETDSEFERAARHRWPLQESWRFLAHDAGAVVGSLGFSARRENTPDFADFAPYLYVWGGVLASHRRRGIATSLLRPLLGFMTERGKTTATFWTHLPDGHAFLTALGAAEKLGSVENRLAFEELDWDELASWQAAVTANWPVLSWEIHEGRVPLDRLAALLPQLSELNRQIPMGSLDAPAPRWELPGITSWYEEMDRRGGEHFLVLLLEGAAVVAVSTASWDARFPDRIYQDLTAVAPAWRGRGLAKGIKAAMLLLIRDRHPEVRLVTTSNAEVNAPMRSINARLGFREHRRDGSYQISRDTLALWLAQRGGG